MFEFNQRNLDWIGFQMRAKTSIGKIINASLNISASLKLTLKRRIRFSGAVAEIFSDLLANTNSVDSHIHPETFKQRFLYDSSNSNRLWVVSSDYSAPGSGYGGFSTSLVLGTLLAEEHSLSFGVMCMSRKSHIDDIRRLIISQGVKPIDNTVVEIFSFEPLSITESDIFIATSWWSFESLCISGIPKNQIIYLVQEDETLFYPSGDKSLMASKAIQQAENLVVNSQILYRHFLTKYPDLRNWDKALCFEPTFPNVSRPALAENKTPENKKRIIFYARPQHARNLYLLGLEVLKRVSRSLEENWEVVFIGTGIPKSLRLSESHVANCFTDMTYEEYLELLQSADIGLSLMNAPHPSYPPLEFAILGIPVVTSSFESKVSLDEYSNSIKVVTPNPELIYNQIMSLISDVENQKLEVFRLNPELTISWKSAFSGVFESLSLK